MWWVFSGFVAGLVASSLMIVYWFYRLRLTMAEKGWRYMSRLWVLVWAAAFFGSASGMVRMSGVIREGSTIDVMLFYTTPILYWISLVALFTGVIFDAIIKTRQSGGN